MSSATIAKLQVDGAQRTEHPRETLARVLPHAPAVGLTRLADITGLDRIGIPVILSVRPNSSTLSVDAGKGVSVDAARASAVMECFERHAGEVAAPQTIGASYDEMARCCVVPAVDCLQIARNVLFSRTQSQAWVLGQDLFGVEPVAMPLDTVRLRSNRLPWSEPLPFQMSSNGLSAGNSLAEAVLGGLLEVIERDAVACQRLAWEQRGLPPSRLDLATVEDAIAAGLLERYADAGIDIAVFDLELDTRVPVYLAYIWDVRVPQFGIYMGYGAHLNPAVALTRALTEAAQSRLVYIAGSRDDAIRHERSLRRTNDVLGISAITTPPPTRDFGERASEATPTVQDDISALLGKIERVGLEHAIVFDLSEPGLPATVVRVAVPGLEGYMCDNYLPGPRALRGADLR